MAIKLAVTCAECWGYDMFDIAVRRIQQLDRGIYPVGILWRLIFESDFAMHVLGNANPSESVPVRSQFTGGAAGFEIQRCRQIIMPVRRPNSWCAYAWDMKLRKTNILDPMAALATEDQTLEAHRPTVERLHAAFANCTELFFDGWTPDWQKWSISIVKNDNLTSTTELSALYTLFCILNFDGQKLVAEPTLEAINKLKENMLYEMMSIEDNKGKVPSIFVHTIED